MKKAEKPPAGIGFAISQAKKIEIKDQDRDQRPDFLTTKHTKYTKHLETPTPCPVK